MTMKVQNFSAPQLFSLIFVNSIWPSVPILIPCSKKGHVSPFFFCVIWAQYSDPTLSYPLDLSDLTWYILYLYVCRPKMQTKIILDPRESGPRWVSTAKQGEGSQLQWTKNIRRYSLSNICPAQHMCLAERNGNISQSTKCTNRETSIYTWIS